LSHASLVEYATSGDVSGDRSAVVGYAAAVFAKENA
jgi:AmmeMemoRadiSam system protein B